MVAGSKLALAEVDEVSEAVTKVGVRKVALMAVDMFPTG